MRSLKWFLISFGVLFIMSTGVWLPIFVQGLGTNQIPKMASGGTLDFVLPWGVTNYNYQYQYLDMLVLVTSPLGTFPSTVIACVNHTSNYTMSPLNYDVDLQGVTMISGNNITAGVYYEYYLYDPLNGTYPVQYFAENASGIVASDNYSASVNNAPFSIKPDYPQLTSYIKMIMNFYVVLLWQFAPSRFSYSSY